MIADLPFYPGSRADNKLVSTYLYLPAAAPAATWEELGSGEAGEPHGMLSRNSSGQDLPFP